MLYGWTVKKSSGQRVISPDAIMTRRHLRPNQWKHHLFSSSSSSSSPSSSTTTIVIFFFFFSLFLFQQTFQTSICIVTSCALLGLTWFGLLTSSESYLPLNGQNKKKKKNQLQGAHLSLFPNLYFLHFLYKLDYAPFFFLYIFPPFHDWIFSSRVDDDARLFF